MAPKQSKIIVGTHSISYIQNRLFATLPFENCEVRKVKDFVRIPAHIYWRMRKKPHRFLTNLFYDAGLNNCGLYHFFNAVNIGNQPWITTFERYIPRDAHHPGLYKKENWYIDYSLKRAAHPSCKKLIALSNYAYRSQLRYLQEYGKYETEIMSKVEVMHAPQQLMIESFEEKKTEKDFITCTIAGNVFFRKGGLEILHVFDRLLSDKYSFRLNIVSNLSYGDYASRSVKSDQEEALQIISKYPDSIRHHASVPNKILLDMLKSSDVGLLPTYDDTYAFFVLECQAVGCPVISTNGATLPENNSNATGWMIDAPLYEDGRSIPRGAEQKALFRSIVEESLYNYLIEIHTSPSVLKSKAELGMERIKNDHNIENYTQKIEDVYNQALL